MRTIEVSDEIYEKIKDQVEAEKKKVFETVRICHLRISEGNGYVRIDFNSKPDDIRCSQTLNEARQTVKALQSAIDFVENHQ